MKNYLNFENDIKSIEAEIDKLKDPYNNEGISTVDTGKIDKLQSDLDKKLKDIYSNLDPWQTTLVARHEDTPKSKFFIFTKIKIFSFIFQMPFINRILQAFSDLK